MNKCGKMQGNAGKRWWKCRNEKLDRIDLNSAQKSFCCLAQRRRKKQREKPNLTGPKNSSQAWPSREPSCFPTGVQGTWPSNSRPPLISSFSLLYQPNIPPKLTQRTRDLLSSPASPSSLISLSSISISLSLSSTHHQTRTSIPSPTSDHVAYQHTIFIHRPRKLWNQRVEIEAEFVYISS